MRLRTIKFHFEKFTKKIEKIRLEFHEHVYLRKRRRLLNKRKTHSRRIRRFERKIERIQGKLNKIDDKFYEKYGYLI